MDTERKRNTWEQPPVSAPKQMCDWHLTREKLPRCGAYFPAAVWRSGYAKGGRHSWWRTSQSEPVYLRQNSTQAVQGGRVSEEAWKRNKQMQTCDIIYFSSVASSDSYPFSWARFIFWRKKQTDAGGRLGSIPLLDPYQYWFPLWIVGPESTLFYSKH